MATTANSSFNNLSQASPALSSGDGVFRRSSLSSPWIQIVRGESGSVSPVPRSPSSSSSPPPVGTEQSMTMEYTLSSSDNSASADTQSEGNVAGHNRPAWNRPKDGAGSVMGGDVSWPSLGESILPTPKLPSDKSKPTPEESLSIPQGPVIAQTPQKLLNSNANPNLTPNQKLPVRQRYMRRGNRSDTGSAQNTFAHSWPTLPLPPPGPPLAPPFPLFDPAFGALVPPPVPGLSTAETPFKGYNWEARPSVGFAPQSSASTRNFPRRGNFGPRPRGENHSGGRRDQNHNHGPRSSNVSNYQMQQQMAPPRSFIRPPPPPPYPAPFVAPHPLRPFGNPMGFDMSRMTYPYVYALPPESFFGPPFIAPPPPPATLPVDPILRTSIVNQINYYFSDDNLVKDGFLRSNMDDQGWVPVNLIANFRRVKLLTDNVRLILDSLRASTIVEVQGDKLRRRDEWKKWLPNTVRTPADVGSQPLSGPDNSTLATSFQNVSLNEVTTSRSSPSNADPQAEVRAVDGSSDDALSGQSQSVNEER